MLLIAGGRDDHNLARLADAAADRGYPCRLLCHNKDGGPPPVSWNIADGVLHAGGESFTPRGTSVYVRYDVFSMLADPQSPHLATISGAWFDMVKGWALAYPEIGVLNRRNESREVNKARALVLAKQAGFTVPETVVTNRFDGFPDPARYIAKPVGGGAYTRALTEMTGGEAPFFVQEKLDYPELRIFRVGAHFFSFRIESATLDSREDTGMTITEVTPPAKLLKFMKRLANALGLDYAAADFKTCPATGDFKFLEINTMPIFTGYDNVVDGRLSDAIFLTLMQIKEKAPGPRKA